MKKIQIMKIRDISQKKIEQYCMLIFAFVSGSWKRYPRIDRQSKTGAR